MRQSEDPDDAEDTVDESESKSAATAAAIAAAVAASGVGMRVAPGEGMFRTEGVEGGYCEAELRGTPTPRGDRVVLFYHPKFVMELPKERLVKVRTTV